MRVARCNRAGPLGQTVHRPDLPDVYAFAWTPVPGTEYLLPAWLAKAAIDQGLLDASRVRPLRPQPVWAAEDFATVHG